MEFGSCTYPGAPERGGAGYDIVDYTQDPPVIQPGHERDVLVQAEHIARMLRIFAAEGMATHVYTFITPESPRSPTRDLDLDIASYSLAKVTRHRYDDPAVRRCRGAPRRPGLIPVDLRGPSSRGRGFGR